jgi:Tfp pilus assembly protein PilW
MTPRAGGFSLIELLVALGLAMVAMGAVLALVAPAQGVFQAQPEVADMQQRLRVGVSTLQRDILAAGAGPSSSSPTRGPLLQFLPPVLPYRFGDVRSDPASGVFHRDDTITLIHVPGATAQATVLAASGTGRSLDLDLAPNCGSPRPDYVCGFTAGMRVLLASPEGPWDIAEVIALTGPRLQVESARALDASVFGAGNAVVSEIESHTYSLKTDARANTFQLMHYDGESTDLPVVDQVVGLRIEYVGSPDPPSLIPEADLAGTRGPWTTYGPKPPPVDVDRAFDTWGRGENCTFALVDGVHVPRLTILAQDEGPLTRLDASMLTDGPWCPDSSHVNRYDADLLRVRLVRVTMRVQLGSALFRARLGGSQEIRFDVAPRNMSGGR